jgi:GntR family transcriptional regulator
MMHSAVRNNRLANTPVYLQLRDALAHRIAAGEWGPAQSMPSEGDLAREYGLSAGTVRKALDLLEHEHVVSRRQGRGTFVLDSSSDELATRFENICNGEGQRVSGEITCCELVQDLANEAERAQLQLQAGDQVYRIRRVRAHQGRPFMAERATLPVALFSRLADMRQHSHRLAAVAQQHGVLLGRAQERISIAGASGATSEVLGIAKGSAVFLLDRVVTTLDGHPAEWRVAECHLAGMHYLAELS